MKELCSFVHICDSRFVDSLKNFAQFCRAILERSWSSSARAHGHRLLTHDPAHRFPMLMFIYCSCSCSSIARSYGHVVPMLMVIDCSFSFSVVPMFHGHSCSFSCSSSILCSSLHANDGNDPNIAHKKTMSHYRKLSFFLMPIRSNYD